MERSQDAITIAGGYTSYRHLGDDLVIRSILADVSRVLPDSDPVLLAEDVESVAGRFCVHTSYTSTRLVNASPRYASIPTMEDRVDAIVHDAVEHIASSNIVGEPWVAQLADQMASSKVFVIAAAGSLASPFANWMLWPRLTEALIAQAAGIPVMLTGAGLGPFTSDEHRRGIRRLIDIASSIDVRDARSRDEAVSLGIERDRILVGVDAAVRAKRVADGEFGAFCDVVGIEPDRFLIVGTRQADPPELLARIASTAQAIALEQSVDVLLMPHVASGKDHDGASLERIQRQIDDRVRTVLLADIPQDLMAAEMIRRARVAMGTRFHNGVFACAAGKPALLWSATSYDERRIRGLQDMYPGLVFEVNSTTRRLKRRARRHVRTVRAAGRQEVTRPTTAWFENL
jgi:polysaccharide pyruvyl transferase WcaK-like protein